MSLSQEHIATLRQEIPMVTRQIQLISGPEFADTVPEVAVAKAALERYKQAAEAHVAEWDRAHRPPIQSHLLNLSAFYNPGAAQAAAPAPATEPATAAGVNPALTALLQALQVRPVQG